METNQFERMVDKVRHWRSSSEDDVPLSSPDLSSRDESRLRRVLDLCIHGRGGEPAAQRRAASVARTFLLLSPTGRRRFFELLANGYDSEDSDVDQAIDRVIRAGDDARRRQAEQALRKALVPPRERLFKLFVGMDGGLAFLIDLREELLAFRGEGPALSALDQDLKRILARFFDVGLLDLQRLTWESPASLLEKLIEYEAVHAIESWDDLRDRLDVDRRLYTFIHPAMPDEPLIFVEVALTQGISDKLVPLLNQQAEPLDPENADTAIFYSISNCHRGLAGVSLGDRLIKRVVGVLSHELPQIKEFATLSPIPGLRGWLESNIEEPNLLAVSEVETLSGGDTAESLAGLQALMASETPPEDETLELWRPVLQRLCARYLVEETRGTQAADAVAHFHLTNGAQVERLNWMANPGPVGWQRGMCLMVNYRYLLKNIESNHDQYVEDTTVAASDSMRKLLIPAPGPKLKNPRKQATDR